MTKEKYNQEMEDIHYQKKLLFEREKIVQEKYIEANKPFEIGDKVQNNRGEKGFVIGYEVGYSSKVVPLLKKMKKDGTQSSIKLFYWSYDKLSKI